MRELRNIKMFAEPIHSSIYVYIKLKILPILCWEIIKSVTSFLTKDIIYKHRICCFLQNNLLAGT